MSKSYPELPAYLGGLLLPIVESFIELGGHGGLTGEQIAVAKSLDNFIQLRVRALQIKPYKEVPFDRIAAVSYKLVEEPEVLSKEESPYKGFRGEDLARRILERKLEQEKEARIVERTAKSLLNTLLRVITPPGLEYLSDFHYILDGATLIEDNLLSLFPALRKAFGEEKAKLKKKYGALVKPYHIIPEVIDWTFYLDIRGEEPKSLESPYWKVLDRVSKLANELDAKNRAQQYLSNHPKAKSEILGGKPNLEDGDLPRDLLGARALFKEVMKKSGPPVYNLDEVK